MTEAKFTKGPWRVDLSCLAVWSGKSFNIASIRGWGYLTGKGCGAVAKSDAEAEEIMVANAHLIAAAPEMYEALETADRMMCTLGARDSIGYNIIKSALAKARGEQ